MELHTPNDTRSDALGGHEALRRHCREVLRLGRRAGEDAGDHTARRLLAEEIGALVAAIRANLGQEFDVLRPLIAAADAWGPARVQQLDDSHAHREDAAAAAERATTSAADTDQLVATARRLVQELMRALQWTARDVLGEELLRDDVIVIDQESG